MLEHQERVMGLAGGVSGPVGVAGYYNSQPARQDFLACGSPVSAVGHSRSQHALSLNELGEANLLEMLQVLTRRRDELRQMDKQLFDLMAECCVRLKPAGEGVGHQHSAIDLSPRLAPGGPDAQQVSEGTAIEGQTRTVDAEEDATADANGKRKGCAGPQQQQQQHQGAQSNSQSRYSPSLHIKKMRLLSGIVSQDDIGEKQQVLAEKELDVREGEKDDDKQASEKQTICSNSTSSFSSTSSSSFPHLPSVKHAYQQQAPTTINDNDDYHRQQQQRHLAHHQVSHQHASTAIIAIKNYENDDDDDEEGGGGGKNNKVASGYRFDTSSSGGSSSASSSDQDQDGLATDTSGGGSCAHGNYRPKLQKFYSIGTAEMSFERSLRQQHLIDSTLATLVQQQQQQQQANMLVPMQQQQQREQANAACFALSPPVAYNKQQVAMLSPLVHFQPVVPHQMAPMHSHHLAHFGAACPPEQQVLTTGRTGPLPLGPPPPLAASEQQLVYMHAQPPPHKISPFDRMLVNAKDLGPIVRKMSFRCHVCTSCFEDRHRLQQHLSIHLNLEASWFEERVIKKTMAQYELRRGDYLCQVCQTRYETTADFDRHMQLHGEKPHQCELCQQDNKFVSFRYFRQLLTHLRSHCFEFTCRYSPECRHIANRKDYLKLHILKHHLNNKLPEQFTICCH